MQREKWVPPERDAERSDCRRVVGKFRVRAQYIMEQPDVVAVLTMTRLIFAGLILLTLSFVHGDKIFSIEQS